MYALFNFTIPNHWWCFIQSSSGLTETPLEGVKQEQRMTVTGKNMSEDYIAELGSFGESDSVCYSLP